MSLENPKGIESSVSKSTKQRRTFLKRATAGAAIASIPGRSAWAGIAGSIVASGHGSDFNQGECTNLLDETSFDKGDKRSFNAIFGGNPFNSQNEGVGNNDFKFGDILTDGPGSDKAGVNNVNLGLVLIYLNALGNGSNGIVYPVLSQHNDNEAQFASYLYANALSGPSNVGGLLMSTVSKYSNGNGCI